MASLSVVLRQLRIFRRRVPVVAVAFCCWSCLGSQNFLSVISLLKAEIGDEFPLGSENDDKTDV